MDIDQRLERLTQRHEALTQTAELLIKDLSEMKVLVNDIAEGTARLLHVAEIHQKRISRRKTRKHDETHARCRLQLIRSTSQYSLRPFRAMGNDGQISLRGLIGDGAALFPNARRAQGNLRY